MKNQVAVKRFSQEWWKLAWANRTTIINNVLFATLLIALCALWLVAVVMVIAWFVAHWNTGLVEITVGQWQAIFFWSFIVIWPIYAANHAAKKAKEKKQREAQAFLTLLQIIGGSASAQAKHSDPEQDLKDMMAYSRAIDQLIKGTDDDQN